MIMIDIRKAKEKYIYLSTGILCNLAIQTKTENWVTKETTKKHIFTDSYTKETTC